MVRGQVEVHAHVGLEGAAGLQLEAGQLGHDIIAAEGGRVEGQGRADIAAHQHVQARLFQNEAQKRGVVVLPLVPVTPKKGAWLKR